VAVFCSCPTYFPFCLSACPREVSFALKVHSTPFFESGPSSLSPSVFIEPIPSPSLACNRPSFSERLKGFHAKSAFQSLAEISRALNSPYLPFFKLFSVFSPVPQGCPLLVHCCRAPEAGDPSILEGILNRLETSEVMEFPLSLYSFNLIGLGSSLFPEISLVYPRPYDYWFFSFVTAYLVENVSPQLLVDRFLPRFLY